MRTSQSLSALGLSVPSDFPVAAFESVRAAVSPRLSSVTLGEQFAGAWNAVAYRFKAMDEHGDAFRRSITGASPDAERYEQERDLFGFFGNGFSVFEAAFYGLFVIGTLLAPAHFPLTSPSEQRKVSPSHAKDAFSKAFPGDPILAALDSVLNHPSYKDCRDIRHVLTHRAAPPRNLVIGGSDEWKILNISLDGTTTVSRRSELAKLITTLLEAAAAFVTARLV